MEKLGSGADGFPVDRLVRIWTVGGGCGTGFRFSSTKVLTAAHVVRGAEKVEVLEYVDGDLKQVTHFERTPWASTGPLSALDTVILETTPKDGVEPWSSVAEKRWKTSAPWESGGFPFEGRSPEHSTRLHGKAWEYAEGQKRLEMTVADIRTDGMEDWRGLSGAPVFRRVAGRLVLSGLVTSGLEKFNGSVLQAVPLPALFEESGFRAALLGEVDTRWSDAFIPELRQVLERHGDACHVLAKHLGQGTGVAMAQHPETLATSLCSQFELPQVSRALMIAHRELTDLGSEEAAEVIEEAMKWALPAAYLHTSKEPPADPKQRRLDLAFQTPLMAEVVLAAAEKRRLEIEPVEGDVPRASRRLPKPLQLGIDPDQETLRADLFKDLQRLVAFGQTMDLSAEDEAKRYLVQLASWKDKNLVPPKSYVEAFLENPNSPNTWKNFSEWVAYSLSELDERVYYVSEATDSEEFLEALHDQLEDLLVVVLKGKDMMQEHRAVGGPLQKVLKRKLANEESGE